MTEKSALELVSDGLDLFAAGKLHEAADRYRAAIAADATVVEAHLALGKALEIMGALDEAIEVLRGAAEVAPTEPLVHTSLSQCLQRKGMIPEAESEMAIAMQLQRRY